MNHIYGVGLIANSFRKFSQIDNAVIFASGVSNSQETNFSHFERELLLLKSAVTDNPDKTFVYFSTTSIYSSLVSPYIAHKLNIEKLISSISKRYLILRLPQVVGNVKNTTLVSYFVSNILMAKDIELQQNAMRFLIDAEDVVRVVDIILLSLNKNLVIDLIPKTPVSVFEIVNQIGLILNMQPKIRLLDHGECYSCTSSAIEKILAPTDNIFGELYWKSVLEKYVPMINNNILFDI